MDIFVKIETVTGPVTTPTGRQGWFRAAGFAWGGIELSRDAVTGQTAGARRHAQVTLTRVLDGASPTFYDSVVKKALLPGITTVACDFFDPKAGALRPSATYILKSPKVVAVKLSAVNGGADAVSEQVTISYSEIQMQHDPSVAKFQDTFSG